MPVISSLRYTVFPNAYKYLHKYEYNRMIGIYSKGYRFENEWEESHNVKNKQLDRSDCINYWKRKHSPAKLHFISSGLFYDYDKSNLKF